MARDRTGQGQVVVVFGATGTAGTGAVQACLADPSVSEVRAVTRRPLGASDPRLGIRSVDLGRAMLRVGLDKSWQGRRMLEDRDLKALLEVAERP